VATRRRTVPRTPDLPAGPLPPRQWRKRWR
jgi:hypothetical protein